MVREIDLLHYLPLFVQEYKEIQKIMKAEEPEFQLVADESEVLKNNQFISTCDETGIARYEKILHITPTSEDTLESRKSRVIVRWNDAVPYTWKVFMQKMQTLCGEDFELTEDWNNYQLYITTHLDIYGQVEELENILGYMPPANILIIAENVLNYLLSGNAFVGAGMAIAEMFQLTDSYNITWTIPASAYAVGAGSGTCEIELTDSFKETMLASEAEAGAFTAHSIAESIEVSDSSQGTIQLGSAANVGNGITYTEII